MNTRQTRKLESRQRILESAARLFRKNGYAATGVDAVMEGAGLTPGGFYSHFESKDALLGECLSQAFEKSRHRLLGGLKGSTREKSRQVLARYLSAEHRDHPEEGCPLVGIAAELGRHVKETSWHTSRYVESLLGEFEKLGIERADAIRRISAAIGALLLSRLVKGSPLSDEVLETCLSSSPAP